MLESFVDPLGQGNLVEQAADVLDQGAVQRDGRFQGGLFQQRVQMGGQAVALFPVDAPGQMGLPFLFQPGLDDPGVEALRVVHHQVDLERVVQIAGVAGVLAQSLFHAENDAGQKRLPEQALINRQRFAAELVALIKAESHQPGLAGVVVAVAAGNGASGIEQRQGGDRIGLVGGQRLDLPGHFQALFFHGPHVQIVAGVAGQPQRGGDHGDEQGGGVGPALDPGPPAFHPQVGAGELGLGKDHVAQQPGDEIAATLARESAQRLPAQPEGAGQRTHQPVDGRAFLGAAAEVHAPQQDALLEPAGSEHVLEESVGDLLQRAELLGKGVDQVAPLRVALVLQALHQPVVQALLQQLEFGDEVLDHAFRIGGVVHRQGRAPNLGPFLLTQIVEEFDKAGDQVGLGEQHVNREANAEMFVQLLHPLFDGQRLGRALVLALLHQVGQADGDEGAVDGPAAAMFLEQVQKAAPSRPVHFLVAVLGGVAAGGIQQDPLVGEPPVAIAGAAHAAHLAGAQRKVQAGVDQRGGFAGAGRADDDVPGQLVQILTASGPAAQPGFPEHRQRFVEPLPEGGDFLGGGGLLFLLALLLLARFRAAIARRGGSGGSGATLADSAGLTGQIGQHVAVVAQRLDVVDDLVDRHGGAEGRDGGDTAQIRGEWRGSGHGDQRPEVPDQAADGEKAGDADQPGIFQKAQDFLHNPDLIDAGQQDDVDAPVQRPILRGVVGGDRLGVGAPFAAEPAGVVAGRGQDFHHAVRAGFGQMPVGRELQGPNRNVVAVAGDQYPALHFVHFGADLLKQVVKARLDVGPAGIEQPIATDADRRLVGLFDDRHQPLPDLRIQERAKVLCDLSEVGVGLLGFDRRGGGGDAGPPHHRHVRAAQVAERAEHRIGGAVQQPTEDRVGEQQQGRRDRRHHPERDVADQRVALFDAAAPVRGQLPLELAASGADGVVDPFPLFLQPPAAVFQQPVAALKTEGQTQIQQFQQVQVLARIENDGIQQFEDFFAAPGFVVKGDQQAVLAPLAGPTPGRVQHHFVEGGAEHVAGPEHRFLVDARVASVGREGLHLLDHAPAQPLGIGMRSGVFQPHDQAQQRRGGGLQRIQPNAAQRGSFLGRRAGRARRRRGSRVRTGAPATRRRTDDGALAVVAAGGKRIVDGHGGLLDHSLMAQNAISRPGNSPPTWKAKPPEFRSCFQNSLLRSSR